MTLEVLPMAGMPRGRSAALQHNIDIAMQRYPRMYRPMIATEAARHFALADLALSFPALLFVIAVPHAGVDAEALRRAVIAGEPLKELAQCAGLPLWLRQLKPAAFAEKLYSLPSGDLVARQIVNFIPRKSKLQARWLRDVSKACRWGHDGFALWAARPGHSMEFRSAYALPQLALWAWYSDHPETELGRLVQKRWRINMDRKQAIAGCNSWIDSVNLHLDLHMVPRQAKLKERTVAGLDFVHLATSEMVADEAVAMRNCLKTYGPDIACSDNELWSIREDGARLATLCIGTSKVDGLPAIVEIRGTSNANVKREVAIAARRWFEMHDIESIAIAPRTPQEHPRRQAWQRGFKPYWLAKRAMPHWLRLNGVLVLWQI